MEQWTDAQCALAIEVRDRDNDKMLRFVERASLYDLVNRTNLVHNFLNMFY